MDTNECRAYPPERTNGDRPKRKPGRPVGIPNPNGGRRLTSLPGPMEKLANGIGNGMALPGNDKRQLREILQHLNPEETTFAMEYMVDMNAKRAATRCGYSDISISGCIILNRPHVRKAVDDLLEIRAKNQAKVANRLLIGLDELGHVDIDELHDQDGCIRPIGEWPPAARQAVTGFRVKELWQGEGEDRKQVGRMVDVKMIDPIRARELLGRHLRLWAEPIVNVNQTNISAQNVQINQKIDLSDFTPEELQVALKLGLKLNGNTADLAPGLSGEEISESAII